MKKLKNIYTFKQKILDDERERKVLINIYQLENKLPTSHFSL